MPSQRKSDLLVVAAWSATIFGLLEGVVLCTSRAYPVIQAAHKVSPDILWVAPLVDLPLFLLLAGLALLALRLLQRWLASSSLLVAYGLFVFLGIYTVVSAPRIIQSTGAVVLPLGLAVVFCRRLKGSEERVTTFLRARLLWIPALVLVAALGVATSRRLQEAWQAHSLPTTPARADNVLVIMMDTVRADRFTRPSQASLTPNIDRLSSEGLRFEDGWPTTSWSLPSQASILTGRYPHEHGADWPSLRLDEKVVTLGEFLEAQGYVTGAFSGNAAWVTPEYLGRGFLRFEVYKLEDLARRTVHGRKLDKLLEKVGYHSAGRGKKAPELIAQFLRFVDDYSGRPFFAYLCFMDVNQGFHARRFNEAGPKPVPVPEVVRAYDRALTVLDAQLGELFAELRRRGLVERTLVVITSDHGESFGAKEADDHDPDGHGTSLYREQSAVPLFLIYPGKVPAGEHVFGTVSLRQVPATITSLLGFTGSPFPGDQLTLAPKGQVREEPSPSVLLELKNTDARTIAQSAVSGNWQYLNHPNDLGQIRKGEELYDFVRDPLEKSDRVTAPELQPILESMRKSLHDLLARDAQSVPKDLASAARLRNGR